MNDRQDRETRAYSHDDREPVLIEDSTAGSEEEAGAPYWTTSVAGRLLARLTPQVPSQVANQLSEVFYLLSALPGLLPSGSRNVLERYSHLRATVEGDSVAIEWLFPNFRFGFDIEPDPSKSGWSFVSNQYLNNQVQSGRLPDRRTLLVLLHDLIAANI